MAEQAQPANVPGGPDDKIQNIDQIRNMAQSQLASPRFEGVKAHTDPSGVVFAVYTTSQPDFPPPPSSLPPPNPCPNSSAKIGNMPARSTSYAAPARHTQGQS